MKQLTTIHELLTSIEDGKKIHIHLNEKHHELVETRIMKTPLGELIKLIQVGKLFST